MAKIAKIAGNFLRFDFWYVGLIILGLTLAMPLVVGMENLSTEDTANVMETLFTLVAAGLFLPLFTPEGQESVFQLVKTKKTPVQVVFLVRLGVILLGAVCLLALHLWMFQRLDSEIDFGTFFLVEMGNLFFVGGLLAIAYVFSRQVVLGMLLPLLYYAYCLFVGGAAKTLGPFYLLRLAQFQDASNWWLMAGVGAGLLGVAIWVRCRRQ